MDAFLDASGSVLATATVPRTITEVQIKNPTVTQKIVDAPADLLPLTTYAPGDPGSWSYHQLSSGDGSLLSDYILLEDVTDYAATRCAEIDNRTAELLAVGFEYDNKTFGLGDYDREQWDQLLTTTLTEVTSYPFVVADVGGASHSLPNVDIAVQFLTAYHNRLTQRIQSGQVYKDQLAAATTKAEVDAIVDTRSEDDPPSSADSPAVWLATINSTAGKFPKWYVQAGQVYILEEYEHQVVSRVMRTAGVTRLAAGARLTTRGHG